MTLLALLSKKPYILLSGLDNFLTGHLAKRPDCLVKNRTPGNQSADAHCKDDAGVTFVTDGYWLNRHTATGFTPMSFPSGLWWWVKK